MKNLKVLSMMLLAAVFFAACDPSDDETTYNPEPTTDFSQNFGAPATRDFIGQVVNTSYAPVANATVKIGNSTTQTDSNGIFIINGANVNEDFAYITATKAGYVEGSRAIVPTTGKNNVRIMLLPLDTTATIQSGESSTVTVGTTQVVFDGAFVDESGNAYSGAVDVSMYHLKPSNENLSDIMPGMLYAENAQGQERTLETYGMMHVDLRGGGGQKLQIANGHTAQIKIGIDASQMASAPATIPLWHFDQEKGYWKEDGFATKQGNQYVGTVSHFSWWNCDAQFPTIELTMTVVDENGNPLPGIAVVLTNTETNNSRDGITDNFGHVSGLVPSNVLFEMNVQFYSACGNQVLLTQNVGPFASDTTLPNIVIDSPDINTVIIEGNLVKCDNTNVTNGYVIFRNWFHYASYAPVTDGSFSFSSLICESSSDTEFKLKGVDYDSLQETDSLQFTYTAPVTNVGNIAACTAITEFMSYQIDSDPVVFLVSQTNGYFYNQPGSIGLAVSAYNLNQNGFTVFGDNVTTPGVYTTANFSIEGSIGYIHSGSVNTMVFTVSNIGEIGEYIDLTFNGTFTDDTGVHTLNGTAHIKRDN
jgi:hypothetical protein